MIKPSNCLSGILYLTEPPYYYFCFIIQGVAYVSIHPSISSIYSVERWQGKQLYQGSPATLSSSSRRRRGVLGPPWGFLPGTVPGRRPWGIFLTRRAISSGSSRCRGAMAVVWVQASLHISKGEPGHPVMATCLWCCSFSQDRAAH